MIVRFSAMGELQAVLESEAMLRKFTEACREVADSLQSLLKENIKVCLLLIQLWLEKSSRHMTCSPHTCDTAASACVFQNIFLLH